MDEQSFNRLNASFSSFINITKTSDVLYETTLQDIKEMLYYLEKYPLQAGEFLNVFQLCNAIYKFSMQDDKRYLRYLENLINSHANNLANLYVLQLNNTQTADICQQRLSLLEKYFTIKLTGKKQPEQNVSNNLINHNKMV